MSNTDFNFSSALGTLSNAAQSSISQRLFDSSYILTTDWIIINTQAEWDALVNSDGIITFTTSKHIIVNTNISTSARIVVAPFTGLFLGANNSLSASLNYTGSDVFITANFPIFIFLNKWNAITNYADPAVPVRGTGTFFNITQVIGGCLWQDVGVIGWGSIGFYFNGTIFDINNLFCFNCGGPWIMSGIQNQIFTRILFNSNFGGGASVNGPLIQVFDDDSASSYIMNLCTAALQVGESFIQIDPALNGNSRVEVQDTYFGTSNRQLFDPAVANSGTFDSITDASVPSLAITSVTNNNGSAQFNFTPGPTFFEKQIVTTSGFTNSTYNVTNNFINIVGTGFFVITEIAFVSNDTTGTVTVDSVIVNVPGSTGTLADNDSVILDTTLSTDYDIGSIVYNVITDTSFQISAPFVTGGVEEGTWSTRSLNKTDANVIGLTNSFNTNSRAIGYGYVNNNATATPVGVLPADCVFGTGGSAMTEGSNVELFKLINEINGIFEYTGSEPFDGFINVDMVASGSSVSAFDFNFQISTNGGVSFGNLTDNVFLTLNSLAATLIFNASATIPLVMNNGDQIKLQVLQQSGASTLLIEDCVISMS